MDCTVKLCTITPSLPPSLTPLRAKPGPLAKQSVALLSYSPKLPLLPGIPAIFPGRRRGGRAGCPGTGLRHTTPDSELDASCSTTLHSWLDDDAGFSDGRTGGVIGLGMVVVVVVVVVLVAAVVVVVVVFWRYDYHR